MHAIKLNIRLTSIALHMYIHTSVLSHNIWKMTALIIQDKIYTKSLFASIDSKLHTLTHKYVSE